MIGCPIIAVEFLPSCGVGHYVNNISIQHRYIVYIYGIRWELRSTYLSLLSFKAARIVQHENIESLHHRTRNDNGDAWDGDIWCPAAVSLLRHCSPVSVRLCSCGNSRSFDGQTAWRRFVECIFWQSRRLRGPSGQATAAASINIVTDSFNHDG